VVHALRRSVLWLAVAMALGVPRPAAAQTFTLTINLVNNSTVNHVNVMDAATGSVLGRCLTLSASFSCPLRINAGTSVRLAAVATGAGNGAVPARLSAGTGPAAACELSSCAFTMTANASVTATFIADGSPMSSITTTIAGDALGRVVISGDPCDRTSLSGPQVCTGSYLTGSTVWLDAEARPATRFAGYSAGTGPAAECGNDLHCEMTLGDDATVTGTFVSMTSFAVSPFFAFGTVGDPPTVFQAIGTYTDSVSQPIQPGAGEWHTITAPPANDGNRAVAVIGGKIYAAGGDVSGLTYTNALHAYDPVGNAWTTLAPMPTTRSSLAGAAAGGQLYAIGGRSFDIGTSTQTVLSTVESYDPASNTWSTRASLPSPRQGLAAGVVNGIIYVVGGTDAGGTIVATVEAYNPATNTWTSRAPLPSPRTGAVVDVFDGILYAVGGRSAGGDVSTVEAYDPSTNTWTAKAPVPAPFAGFGAFVDGVLYFTGGGLATYAYDPVADAWSSRSRPGIAHVGGPSGVGLNGVFYLVGAFRVTDIGLTVHMPTAEAFTDSLRWSLLPLGVARIDQNGSVTPLKPGATGVVASVGSRLICDGSCGLYRVYGPSSLELNGPTNGSVLRAPITVIGWALNTTVPEAFGTGVNAVHVWAFPAGGGAAIFLGEATYGLSRPDVAAVFGSQFTNSGFSLTGGGLLAPGPYVLAVYGRNAITGLFDVVRTVNVTIAPPVTDPFIDLDTPREGFVVNSSFEVAGWALDAGAPTGTGVDTVQFYVFPNDGASPGVFMGTGTYGLSRPDVAAVFGDARFTNTGFHFSITGLGPGAYVLGVYGRSTVTGTFSVVKTIHFTVDATALMAVNPPVAESIITAPVFDVDGWSIDRTIESTALSGTGVDTLHVWAYPNPGSSAPPIFLGVATVGLSRPDVAALYGSRYGPSGFHLAVDRNALGLSNGVYNIVVHSHSTVTNTFNNATVVRVTLQ
jgi:N-acetylneuraminic acid mutarotase